MRLVSGASARPNTRTVMRQRQQKQRRVLHLGCKLPSPSPATYWAGMGDAWPVIHAMLPAFAECYRTRGGGGGAPNLSVPQALQAEGWHACPSWGATLQGTLAHAAPHVPLQMRSHAEVFMNAAKVVGIAPPLGFYCRNASSNSTSSSSSSGMKAATGRAKPLLEQTAAKALRLNIDSWTWSEVPGLPGRCAACSGCCGCCTKGTTSWRPHHLQLQLPCARIQKSKPIPRAQLQSCWVGWRRKTGSGVQLRPQLPHLGVSMS